MLCRDLYANKVNYMYVLCDGLTKLKLNKIVKGTIWIWDVYM